MGEAWEQDPLLKTVCSTQSWAIPNANLASYEILGPCSVPQVQQGHY